MHMSHYVYHKQKTDMPCVSYVNIGDPIWGMPKGIADVHLCNPSNKNPWFSRGPIHFGVYINGIWYDSTTKNKVKQESHQQIV